MTPTKTPLYQTLDPAWLREQYIDLGRPKSHIASDLGVDPATVTHALQWHGIEREPDTRPELTREMLYEMYVTRRMYMREIAERTGYSETFIADRLRKFGITIRPQGNDRRPDAKPWHDEGWLIFQHYHQGLTYEQMAALAGCHPQTIVKAMARHYLTGNAETRAVDDAGQNEPAPVPERAPEPAQEPARPRMTRREFAALVERARVRAERRQAERGQVADWLADIVFG